MGGSSRQHTSAAEEVNAKVGLAKKKFFNANLDPRNRMEKKDATTNKKKYTLRNSSEAEAMQTLSANSQYYQALERRKAY